MEGEYNPERERAIALESHKNYVQGFLELKHEDKEKIEFVEVGSLADEYTNQIDFLEDERLNNIFIVKVPDELWHKGSQPSESHAERQVVLFKESYFNQENPDEIAWLTHEVAHLKRFLDLGSSEEKYNQEMQTLAFEDIGSQHTYPNNKVEEYTFTKQFSYLKDKGFKKEEVIEMLTQYYDLDESDNKDFFDNIIDSIYS